jgi:hypothetical protein
MKKITFLSITFLMFSAVLSAQVTESEQYMSQGTYNSLSIELPTGSEKSAPKEWTKFFKKYGKTKKNRKTDEYFTDNVSIVGMSNNSVDVYATFNGNIMTAWFDLGGVYLSSNDNGFATGEQILLDFGLHLKMLQVEAELKGEAKTMKNLQSDMKKLQKSKAGLEKDIENWKAKIAQAEADIEQNIKDQEEKTIQIGNQEIIVEQVKARLAELKLQ